MTSKIKVDNINKVSDDSNIIKKCGTTTTIGSGASNPIVVDGSAVTLGRCGGTVALASGATQTGFGRTGTVDWQTGSIKTATFTAANGEGYFCNTSGGAFTVNLPAGSSGAIVSVADYTRTFQTNPLTVSPNGSEKIGGVAAGATLNTEGQSATFVYVDGTEGWINVQETSNSIEGRTITDYIIASGGSESTSGDYKIHTFTGPGTFQVTNEGTPSGSNTLDYLVVAGGGSGGQNYSAGGGAGGYRESSGTASGSYSISPLGSGVAALAAAFTTYPITVGAGGTGAPVCSPTSGSLSTFSSITSAGGGRAGANFSPNPLAFQGQAGGSGGGSRCALSGGAGNTPPVSPSQGNPGGAGASPGYAGGGGGATAAGTAGTAPVGGNGGAGATSSITASPVTRAGGGAGRGNASGGSAGPGGGGTVPGGAGGTNTGGGGGAAQTGSGGNGGSGIVVIRYKFQN